MAPREQRLFPKVTDSIWATIVFELIIIIGLFMLQAEPASPFVFYSIVFFNGVIIFAGSDMEFRELKDILGFDLNAYTGSQENIINILLAVAGIGLIAGLFGLVQSNLLRVFAGTENIMAILGLYPAAVQEFSVFFAEIGAVGTMVTMLVVAVVETFQVVFVYKNVANWLHNQGVSPTVAVLVALLLVSPVLWGITHLFAWTITLFAFLVFIAINIAFFGAFFILDYIGVFTPETRVAVRQILSSSAIGGHWAWNTLTALTVAGVMTLPPLQIAAGGVALFFVSGVAIVVVGRRASDLVDATNVVEI